VIPREHFCHRAQGVGKQERRASPQPSGSNREGRGAGSRIAQYDVRPHAASRTAGPHHFAGEGMNPSPDKIVSPTAAGAAAQERGP
jgi:hypothetical protein